MIASSAIAQPGGRAWRRRFIAGGVLLVLMLVLTWGLESLWVRHVADSARRQQAEAVGTALSRIEQQFGRLQRDLMARAIALAEAPRVVEGLRAYAGGEASAGTEQVVRFFASSDLPAQDAAELYDASGGLVAWHGFSMLLDAASLQAPPAEALRTAIVEDGTRTALAVWWPVLDGARVLGAVRVMRYVRFDMPVRNQYLRDYSIADVWTRSTRLPVRVQFGEGHVGQEAPAATREQSRLLQGADGTVLGRVVVGAPSMEALAEATRNRFGDVQAFWAVLLLFWLMAGLWHGYWTAPPQPRRRRVGWFALVGAAWWGLRYVLLALNVPGRWQPGKAPLSPLFDPMHLASTVGGGLMRSTGDLLLSALFALVFALAFVELAGRVRGPTVRLLRSRLWSGEAVAPQPSALRFFAVLAAVGMLLTGLAAVLAVVAQHAVLDSTLDYFARSGFLLERLVLVVFCTLLLATVALVLLAVGGVWIGLRLAMRYRPQEWPVWALGVGAVLVWLLSVAVLYEAPGLARMAPPVGVAAFVAAGLGLGLLWLGQAEPWMERLTLRSVLPSIFLLTVVLYPHVEAGLDAQRRAQMREAANSFEQGTDPRVLYAIEQVLREVRAEPAIRAALQAEKPGREQLDSLASALLRVSMLSSLGGYDAGLVFLDADGEVIGGQWEAEPLAGVGSAGEYDILRQMYAEGGSTGILIGPMTGSRERERFEGRGIVPFYDPEKPEPVGWAVALAVPQTLPREGGTPFPYVLLPSSSNRYADRSLAGLSLAEFRDGGLVRSLGHDFGRYRLAEDVRRALLAQPGLWLTETVQGQAYLTYYRRQESVPAADPMQAVLPAGVQVIAVRVSAVNAFDHLYYLLRLIVAGLFIGLPLYVVGLYLRRRAGLLPAPRVRFRDRVLNAFLGVGILTVAAVGFVGLRVVTAENERATQSWLEQHLERAEEMLALDADAGELPYRVLERVSIDSLSVQVGLDLNVYRDRRLVRSSRPQLVRDRLLDERLPVDVYRDLYFEGYRFTSTDAQVGSFTYAAGYRALPDEQGRPRYVISAPTLPEQERIEEERARTVAYLFGSLLLLVVVVMLTAAVLARALTRPIGRLRAGLEAVARGRFDRTIPAETRDEVGDLVRTFNAMQEQLAESRRQLAQQERQLAWREMARQVAHEIKNPLTPMKLSVQHLRRAYDNLRLTNGTAGPGDVGRFTGLFDRITSTLIEQIDTLARIANEFSTFARMPTRVLERLDLNNVIREAVALMQEEAAAEIEVDLAPVPLVLEADREELRRIFINLIKNALQATPEERAVRVDVATRHQHEAGTPGWAYVTVADTGTGIPQILREKIFEPNFSTKTSGTGLGLAIVKKSVETLRGEVGFETEEGIGTTFWMRLPLAEETGEDVGWDGAGGE